MSLILGKDFAVDPFGSQMIASQVSVINYKPTWGVTDIRYSTTTTGTGASVSETGGEFILSSGTATSNIAQIETVERGQYQAGSEARFGIGVRVPTAPASTADMKWGYFDDNNGFYVGYDATGVYVARRSGGSDSKVYQSSWNVDVLDGTGSSGLTLSLSDGVISQVEFTWYGYGVIEYSFVLYNATTQRFKKIIAHKTKVSSSASIIDPNQPLRFSVENGASNTTNYDLYIGGHQFEYFNGEQRPQLRRVSELLTDYTTATNTNWQPLLAVRPKATHGTSGRDNSVVIRVVDFHVSADNEMEVRLTYAGTTSNLSWAAPTGWTAAESAAETKVTGGTALTTSADGYPIDYDFVSGSRTASDSIDNTRQQLSLGQDREAILWVRRLSGSGAMVVKHAHITWVEEW